MITLLLIVLFISKKIWLKYLVIANCLCWFLYYVAVKLSYYSYGSFGNRYALFFIPAWLISLFAVLFETGEITRDFLLKHQNIKAFQMILERRIAFQGIVLAVAFVYCLAGWETIKVNWNKEDIRGVTNSWYREKGYDTSTLVYYGSDSGFAYYCEHHEEYDDSKMDNVVWMKWYRDKTVDEYTGYLNELYQGKWPDDLYIVASHIYNKDVDILSQCFTNIGYVAKDIYNKNGGRLIYLTHTNG